MGTRWSGPLVSIVALGAGIGGAVANAQIAVLMPGNPKKLRIRKIMWHNGIAAQANLLVGYGDLTGAGSLFRQILPNIIMAPGLDGELDEAHIPLAGNTPDGMYPDAAVPTGTTGDILVETDSAAVGAAPNNVQVRIEVEEE